MQPLPPDHPFRKHAANLRAVAAGLKQAERIHKDAIRRNDDPATGFAARVHQMMVGLVAEAHLRKIISDPDGFNAREREILRSSRSQLQRWTDAVDLAFRRHYVVPFHLDVQEQLDATRAGQFDELRSMLNDDLRVVIEDRNKVAHGQWVWMLNAKETAFLHAADAPLNYVESDSRKNAIGLLADLVHALVVSEPTFQRDYDNALDGVRAARARFAGADYLDFAAALRARRR